MSGSVAGSARREVATLRDVHKSFGDESLFCGLDLHVPPGGISMVIGGSGCGKSTLLRVLLGLAPYARGSVRLLGEEVSALSASEHARLMMRVGMLFQFGALFDSMTVQENVGFALRTVLRRAERDVRRVVRENLLLVGLKNVEHLYPSQLSGGMRKRVALARAIAHEPELLLVDEPTSGLDPIMAQTVNELIVQLRERLGVTVLCISHDLEAAFQIADQVSMLYRGRIIASGSPQEMRSCPDEAVQQFVRGQSMGPIAP